MIKEKDLPHGWRKTTIERVSLVDSGQSAPQGERHYEGREIFVRAGDLNNLTDGKYVGDFCQKIADSAIKQYKLKKYAKGSVVFPKSGMSVKTNNIAILKYDSYVVNHLAILQPKNLNDGKFLFLLLRKYKISNLSKNPSYPSIRLSNIRRFDILWPPKHVRERIVLILEIAEKLKAWRQEADLYTNEFLKSKFFEMFGHPLAKTNSLAKSKLREIISIIVPTRDKPKSFTGNIPWVTLPDLADSIYIDDSKYKLTKDEAKPTKTRLFPKETVILSCAGSLGKVAIAKREIYSNQQFYGLVCNKKRLLPEFLAFQLLMFGEDYYRRIGGTSTLTFFKKEAARNIEIILPEVGEQEKFAEIVKHVEEMRNNQKKAKKEIENLYDALMQKAFSGELVA